MYKLASVKLWLFLIVTAASIWLCYLGRINGMELAALLGWAWGVYCYANVETKKATLNAAHCVGASAQSVSAQGVDDDGDVEQRVAGFMEEP